MQLDEFLIKLGVVSDIKELNDFTTGLKSVGKVAVGLVGALGGLTAGITAFFGSALGGLDELNDLATDTNTNLAFIQKFGYAAQLAGSSVADANTSIKGLSQTIGEAANGLGRGEATFKALGMSAKNADGSIKSTEQVIGEVQKKLVGLSKQQQISILQKLGISQSMVQLLSDTTGQMTRLMSEAEALGLVTANGADAAGDYNDAMDRMNLVVGALRTNIAVGLAPALTEMVNKFKAWLIANKDLIKNGLEITVKFILAAFQAIINFITVIYKVIDATMGWRTALILLLAVLIKVKWAMVKAFAVNPITWVVVAITALIALVDDFMTYLEGGESFFGDYWKPFAEALEALKPLIGVVKTAFNGFLIAVGAILKIVANIIIGAFKVVGNIIAGIILLLTGNFDGFFQFLKDIFGEVFSIVAQPFIIAGDAIGAVFSGIAEFISSIWEYISAAGKPVIDFFMGAVNGVLGAINKVSGFFSKVVGGIKKGIKAVTGEVEATVNSDLKTVANNTQTSINYANAPKAPTVPKYEQKAIVQNNQQDVKININTSDPVVAGKTAANELKRSQQLAQRNTGGARGY